MPVTPAPPPPDALAWVERELGTGTRVLSTRRMKGGIASAVHRVRVDQGGVACDVVLRRWLRDDWGDPSEAIDDEAKVLTALEQADLGVQTPQLRAMSRTGHDAGGRPALLMDRVPGRVHLRPKNPKRWLQELARNAARVHAANVDAPRYESWLKLEGLRPPNDTHRPDLWRAAFAVVTQNPPPYVPVFTHRDYQHFNVLWERETLAGTFDWGSACTGPADIDIGHCRLNLAVLFAPEWAEQFLAMYEAEAGRSVDPWWDLQELIIYREGWQKMIPIQVGGRADVDANGMTERVETVIERVLDRL